MATRQVLADLVRAYEKRTGRAVTIHSIGGVEAAERVRSGEEVDFVVLASNVIVKLEAEGHIVEGTCAGFVRSEIAVAVPSGAPHPDIRDEVAVRNAMRAARRLCYSTGPSGDHLKVLWKRWGIADEIGPRALLAPPGIPVGEVLAKGDADIGFQQLSELLGVSGIDVIGPLPPDIQATTLFATGIAGRAKHPDEAQDFIAFLASQETDTIKRRFGMQPAANELPIK
jgi:molybdate transport system substrate-binding protein